MSQRFIINLVYLAGLRTTVPVLTFGLRGGKKRSSKIFARITCLWDSRANNVMIESDTLELMSAI